MKRLILLLIGAIIGFAAAYFYLGGSSMSEEAPAEAAPPRGVITEAEGIALDKAFNSRHQLISDSIVKRPDNRSSWFSLSDVRAYLDYAEQETKKNGYTMEGVRIYLGAYPDSGGEVGYTTMFLVPTGKEAKASGNMFNFALQGGDDIPGGPGLNDGGNGDPPPSNYPNN